ncbi:MAG: hypothetical protein IJH03_05475, partial [Clostridia bacterium]|nr:hypothetical protein [Clostridia bacterium]
HAPTPFRPSERHHRPSSVYSQAKGTAAQCGGTLAGEFQPLAACKNLDYAPGNLLFLQLAIN